MDAQVPYKNGSRVGSLHLNSALNSTNQGLNNLQLVEPVVAQPMDMVGQLCV